MRDSPAKGWDGGHTQQRNWVLLLDRVQLEKLLLLTLELAVEVLKSVTRYLSQSLEFSAAPQGQLADLETPDMALGTCHSLEQEELGK